MISLVLIIAAAIIVFVVFKYVKRHQQPPTDTSRLDISHDILTVRMAIPNKIQDDRSTGGSGVQQRDLSDEDIYIDNYWIPVESTQRKVNVRLKLKYRKTNNEIHEREFDVESFQRGDQGYHIHGYCHRKQRKITLSSIGIIDPIDKDTGEQIIDIIKYLEEKYIKTKGYKYDLLFDKYGWALYCLVYLSATSGSILKKERDIITSFVKSLEGFSELEDEWIDSTIKDIYRPGKMEIRNWVKAALQKGENLNILNDAIERLSLIQKPENSEFKSFVNYLRKRQEV